MRTPFIHSTNVFQLPILCSSLFKLCRKKNIKYLTQITNNLKNIILELSLNEVEGKLMYKKTREQVVSFK